MILLALTILFIFGCFVGSFLGVLIDRLPNNRNPFKGRSQCNFCKKTLSPIDLIPVISFVLLKGKCRYCHRKLSIQYPLIEIITGLMFIVLFLYIIFNFQLPFFNQLSIINYQLNTSFIQGSNNLIVLLSYLSLIIIFSSFLVIFVVDLKHQIIPDEMLISVFAGIILFNIGNGLDFNRLINLTVSGLGAAAVFLIIFLLTKGRGMGFGDVKLVLLLGWWLGFPDTVVALYLAFLTGALISVILILLKQKKLKDKIAFGPFLLLGAVTEFFLQYKLWVLWQNIFHF